MKLEPFMSINSNRITIDNGAELKLSVPKESRVVFRFYYHEDKPEQNEGVRKYIAKEYNDGLNILKMISEDANVEYFYEIYPIEEKISISRKELLEKLEHAIMVIDPSRI